MSYLLVTPIAFHKFEPQNELLEQLCQLSKIYYVVEAVEDLHH